MLIKEFPDIDWLKHQIRTNFENQKGWNNAQLNGSGWPTVVLNTSTYHSERKDVKGPISLFTNLSGSSTIGIEGRNIPILDNAYIVTNSQEHYDLLINEVTQTETFNVHFGDKFCAEAWHTISQSDERLLDNPQLHEKPESFYFRSLPKDDLFNSLVKGIKCAYTIASSKDKRERLLYNLFFYLCYHNSKEIKITSNISSVKASTKKEIVRRLFIGRDFIHANYHRNIGLDDLTRATFLSKFHFLRSYKRVFGSTPYQYIKRLRLQKATELLKTTDLSVGSIALYVGLENGSSLSRMLKNSLGFYPESIRSKN